MSAKTEKFGKYLRALRGATSQRTLAVAIGKTTMYISNIENGKNNPPDETLLKKIADVLKLNNEKRLELFDEAAAARNTVAHDLVMMLSSNQELRQFVRDVNAGKCIIKNNSAESRG